MFLTSSEKATQIFTVILQVVFFTTEHLHETLQHSEIIVSHK